MTAVDRTDRPASLVLASASPRRRELLVALNVPFIAVSADVDEQIAPGENAVEAAVRLARTKAEAVASSVDGGLVLAADTIVVLDGRVLGKPRDAADAATMLHALRDRNHTVVTAVAMLDARSGRCESAAPATSVWMRPYTEAEIGASITAGTPFDKAGAYAIQDDAFTPVARIDGCYCNVVGLPLWTVFRFLHQMSGDLRPRPPAATRPVCASCPLAVASTESTLGPSPR